MKKMIAAVLAVLCLAGCSAREEKADMIGVTVVTTTDDAQTVVKEPVEEAPVQEFEIEVECALPAYPEPDEGTAVTVQTGLVEGLVGDAVGYSFQLPVFTEYEAAETMNEFYTELVNGLVEYANGAVNDRCLQENCIASVYGTVLQATLTGDRLDVEYECRVEFSNSEEPVINERTEIWNVTTGEVTSEVG